MSVKPELAFDVCWEVYRGAREVLETKRGISAQLRHLRKPEFGGYDVEKQPRAAGKVLRGEDFGTVWEYQLRRAIRRKVARVRARGAGRKVSVRVAR